MKKFFDPIYGFIILDPLEEELLETLALKRLMGIHQIASAFLVYGSGRHSRLEHSLGTMHLAGEMFSHASSDFPFENTAYYRQVVRIAALLHDVGHPPFSHLGEVLLENTHEEWTQKIIQSTVIRNILQKKDIDADLVAKIAVGKKHASAAMSASEKLLSEFITSDAFGADRIDYLLRDSYHTGMSYGKVDYLQLISSLQIIPEPLCLALNERALDAAASLVISRYFMYKRVYMHPKVLEYEHHLQQFLQHFYAGNPIVASIDRYLQSNDYEVFAEIFRAFHDLGHPEHQLAKKILDYRGEKNSLDLGALPLSHPKISVKNFTEDFFVISRHGKLESAIERLQQIFS